MFEICAVFLYNNGALFFDVDDLSKGSECSDFQDFRCCELLRTLIEPALFLGLRSQQAKSGPLQKVQKAKESAEVALAKEEEEEAEEKEKEKKKKKLSTSPSLLLLLLFGQQRQQQQ